MRVHPLGVLRVRRVLVAEVFELQRDLEIDLFEPGDDGLKIVTLLSSDANLFALGL